MQFLLGRKKPYTVQIKNDFVWKVNKIFVNNIQP